ncbi:HNH endonuclease [Pantoea stewartii]|uniref:HNH endonuclease n=1 Tax=Pantoea stewartii TaxID=66269 RepID=UPI00197FBB2E|nr:HNH endonuclease [Pantoea stewartii]
MARKSNKIPFKLTEDFVIDSSSPSGLSWKNPTSVSKGHRKDDYKNAAGSFNRKTGYWQVKIRHPEYKDKNFFVYVHRLIWMIANGKEIPDGFVVDHKEGKINHPDNLRLATNIQNFANKRLRNVKETGLPSNVFARANGKYQGKFSYNNKAYISKNFDSIIEVEKWLSNKRQNLHGEFFHKDNLI